MSIVVPDENLRPKGNAGAMVAARRLGEKSAGHAMTAIGAAGMVVPALALGLALAACGLAPKARHVPKAEAAQEEPAQGAGPVGDTDSAHAQGEAPSTSEETMRTCTVRLGDKTFEVRLADNATARAFAELLPLDLSMEELNGNEKYRYLDQALPADASCPGRIEAGDLMLYGSDCVVLFYRSLDTSYSYTRIGRLVDASDLFDAVGTGDVDATFAQE